MLRLRADPGRLLRSRFALSRMAELSCALEVLAHPERAPFAHAWVALTRPRLAPRAAALVHALVSHGSWYVPDFLVPWPTEYEPTLETELTAVAATPDEVVRAQLDQTFGTDHGQQTGCDSGPHTALPDIIADELARGGGRAVAERAAEELRICWEAVLADSWPMLRRIMDEDIRDRAARAMRVGLSQVVIDLHPSLQWDGEYLTVDLRSEVAADPRPGLVLTPSVFLPSPAMWRGTPEQVMLGYPARGRGRIWSQPSPMQPSVVLGARRTTLLEDLRVPRSTKELAHRHALSPATVSYHLGRLREAALITSRRSGPNVLHAQTTKAESLLATMINDAVV
ncbi:DUF5937 family protein [Actinophytocola sp. NPDC049390]|uniref:DUF5937 family protein n=1 Tax=Actinophytocola sp. NPDC049390 TaxID=3363894 RepID=UPI0037B4FF85